MSTMKTHEIDRLLDRLVTVVDRDEEDDCHECAKCHAPTSIPFDLEPTAICNLCAQELVPVLVAEVRRMLPVLRAARIESGRHDEEASQGVPCEVCVAVAAHDADALADFLRAL